MRNNYSFSVWALVALVVGNAVGAGIYTTSGFSLAALGSREWVLLAWFVAGLIALCGAVSYSMLVQGITESGGEYVYLSRTIHPIAGFIAGWVSLLAGFPGAIAFSASAFETYAVSAVPELVNLPTDLLAIIVIVFAGLIHIVRVKSGARIHETIVALMLVILIIVVLWSGSQFLISEELPTTDSSSLANFSIFAFANSLVWISLSYSGFNAAAYIAGEVKDAKTVVPKGMVVGTLITIALCVAVNAIMLYGVDPGIIIGQADIAAKAANALAGNLGQKIIEVVIAVSLLTSITAMALAGPRVYAKMAEDGALPSLFKARAGTPPRMSIVLQIVTSITLVLIADLRDLLSYLGFTLSLCLALAVSSLFVRHVKPKSIYYPIAPLVFVLSTVLFAVLSAVNDPTQFYAGAVTVIVGSTAYLVSCKKTYEKI